MKAERDDSPCPAAHARAVVTVRLTLLLMVVGAALLLFSGLGVLPPGQEFGGGAVERLK